MKITKDTVACISIAERPGNFGASLFNATFKKLGMDYIYKPFKVMPKDLKAVIAAIKTLNIRGCGVSMPHKSRVIPILDHVDPLASEIGAVNTIVNDNGVLTGYNTDFLGAKRVLTELFKMSGKTALVIGAGGAARAIVVALKESGARKIFIVSRNDKKAKALAKEFGISSELFSKRFKIKADLLANATPVGMAPHTKKMIISAETLGNFEAVMDVVVSPLKSRLIELAEKKGKIVIPGYRMSLYQAMAQFKLYTNVEPPLAFMKKEVQRILA